MTTTNDVNSLLIGMVAATATLILIVAAQSFGLRSIKALRGLWAEKVIFLGLTTPAKDMVPLLNRYLSEGDVLQLTGSNGDYIRGKNGSYFKNNIRRWLNDGVKIEYFLTNADPKSVPILRKIESDFPNKFSLYVSSTSISKSGKDHRINNIADLFQDLHPILLHLKGGKRAMFIEYDHPPGSPVAYAAKFVPPSEMDADAIEEFEFYEERIAVLRQEAIN
ncbi:MAG: hypothetical protein KDC18_16995 [Alphaproteobacteria bacterium]|nr:hypothetical protein [Alphaproteobacteria bacterium]MCB9929068.1 hypothetical protein [Alphaproteobacteria bacterium]